jgi:hypothetical protein
LLQRPDVSNAVNPEATDDDVRLAKEQEKSVFEIDGAYLERARRNLNGKHQLMA